MTATITRPDKQRNFNLLFLLYAAALSLSVWVLVTLCTSINPLALYRSASSQISVRPFALYLLASTALFAMLWLKDVVPAMLINGTPVSLKGTGMNTNPIEMTDFTFTFPLTLMSVMLLWKRCAWGVLAGGAFLVYGVIEAISVATDQTFGHISDPTQSLAMVPVFAVLTVIGLVPTLLFLRNISNNHVRGCLGTAG